jgi:hypothetical protein
MKLAERMVGEPSERRAIHGNVYPFIGNPQVIRTPGGMPSHRDKTTAQWGWV